MDRAQKFYETVLDIQLSELPMPEEFCDLKMLSFPWVNNEMNISGALVKTKNLGPGMGGTLVYFTCADCLLEESRVEAAGGKVVQPKMPIGEHGFCSVVMDTEGNAIGLHSIS